MGQFVHGTLIENEDGATYESEVYDRFLKLRLTQGEVLSIFDPTPISSNLLLGTTYEMVLVSSALNVRVSEEEMPDLLPKEWEGTIVQLDWQAISEEYVLIRPELLKHSWVLVKTDWGHVLISRKIVERAGPGQISVNQRIRWKNVRLDLFAVV